MMTPPDRGSVLVGDIGGTHSRLAIAERHAEGYRLTERAEYLNAETPDLAHGLRTFLAGRPRPERACFAIAAPIEGQRARLTNLDWEIDALAISRDFGIGEVRLVNDFEAVARGLDCIAPDGLACLQAGARMVGAPRVVLGPGTGLGVALETWTGHDYQPWPGEGGHAGFAPVDDEQIALLRFLQARHGRVSVERILSGPGISQLYEFCRAASGRPVRRAREAAEVSRAALAGSDPVAIWALRLFCRILGQTAGDLALVARARGGVYLAGGIPGKILPILRMSDFLAGFHAKGRFSAWMEQVPVEVVTDPDIGLKGAASAIRSGDGG